MCKLIKIFVATLILSISSKSMSKEINPTVIFPDNECAFFISHSPVNAKLLALFSQNKYMRLAREHMGIFKLDEGTWEQDENGIVNLYSDNLYRSIKSEFLWIGLVRNGAGNYLDQIKKDITNYLDSKKQQSFSIDEIESISTWKLEWDESKEDSAIFVLSKGKDMRIPRDDVLQLLSEISIYESADDIQTFTFRPFKYRNHVMLEWKTKGDLLAESEEEIIESIEGTFVINISEDEKVEIPKHNEEDDKYMYIDLQVSMQEFIEAAGMTQPFIYYKKMNEFEFQKEFPHVQTVLSSCRGT